MTDLDFSIDGMTPEPTRDPWLERRLSGFGCSELAALLVALDLRASDGCTKKIVEDARLLFSRKARGVTGTSSTAKDLAREIAVLDAWIARGCPGTDVIPASVRHATTIPKAWQPLVDLVEPRLRCSPDAWGVDAWGDDVYIEIKTTFARYYERPWAHAVQAQGGIAVMRAARAVVVCGPGWVAEPGGDLVVWPLDREESLIAEIRGACASGWQRVVAMKGVVT